MAGTMTKKAPKYQKIKEYILQGIASRNFVDGVPSENQLAEKFSVSRMTARRALNDLEREGSVERIPGKGTFVRNSGHYTQGFFRVRPFRKWAEDLGADIRTEVLESRIVDPPEEIAGYLEYHGQTIRLCILNYLDDVPVRYAVRYLRADQCADILWENLEEHSIHDILINRYRLPLTRICQSMTAVGLPEDLAGLFREAPGFPVFHFQRTAYSFDTAVTYVEYFMRGDMAFNDTFTPMLEPADFQPPLR